jgi:transcription antitermination factor NusA-like protein
MVGRIISQPGRRARKKARMLINARTKNRVGKLVGQGKKEILMDLEKVLDKHNLTLLPGVNSEGEWIILILSKDAENNEVTVIGENGDVVKLTAAEVNEHLAVEDRERWV